MQKEQAGKRDQWFRCGDAALCGACTLCKLPYKAQLREKQKRMEALLGGFGTVSPILGMENPFYYRNKVHAVFATDKRGDPISGIYQQGSHRVVPVKHCLLENQKASEIIHTVTGMIKGMGWKVYNEYTHRGLLRHIVVRVSETTGQVMVTLVATSLDLPRMDAFVEALRGKHPEITTVVVNQNARITSAVLGNQEKTVFGPGYIEDILLGKRFRISSRSFYQVNSRQTAVLYQTAIDVCQLKGNEVLLDAYCGTGTIGICMSGNVRKLIGVEINRSAVLDARVNAELNHVEQASFLVGDAGDVIERLSREHIMPDTVVMDPPRAGSTEKFLRTILNTMPDHVVYISCNPETLRNDLSILCDAYSVNVIQPVDMFPNTEHVETVCLLTHNG